jgi:deoxyadenosine/deoxycytidine kinase
MRVELVGGMACGKSTLAKELQQLGCHWVSEDLDSNPFLEPCYRDFKTFRFPSQMWFALTKYKEIGLYSDPRTVYVHDQAVINNNAYTNLMYEDDPHDPAHRLVTDTFVYTEETFGPPDVIVRLKCDPQVLLQRIKQRGRHHEQDIDISFLYKLDNHIEDLLEKFQRRNDTEVLYISSDLVDFENDKDFVKSLYEQLEKEKEKKYGSSASRHSNLEIATGR